MRSPENLGLERKKSPAPGRKRREGVKWLAVAIPVQLACVGIAIAAGKSDVDTFKAMYFPSSCPFPSGHRLGGMSATYDTVTTKVAYEEFVFRVLLQEMMLKQFPKWVLGKIAPSKVHWVDSKPAKIARVALSAFVFSAAHLQNRTLGYPDQLINIQLASTFGLGLVAGALQEKNGTAWGPIGLHLGYNVLAPTMSLAPCWQAVLFNS